MKRKSEKAISFISEHTAEFVLVPKLVNILSKAFSDIIPIYLWLSREGNDMAKRCAKDVKFRIICVYPRRPKVTEPGKKEIIMKINTELFKAAKFSEPKGIPIFAGIPLVSTILSLNLNSKCSWFRIMGTAKPLEDIEIRLALDGTVLGKNNAKDILKGPLLEKELISIVREFSSPMSWDNGIETLSYLRAWGENIMRFLGGYKPFSLLMPLKD